MLDNDRGRIKADEREALRWFATGDPDARFWISWLEEQGFCEYKLCLRRRGAVAPDSDSVRVGIIAHETIKREHDALAGAEMTVEDAVVQAIGLGESSTFAEYPVMGGCLSGIVDGLVLGRNSAGLDTAWVVDNKTRPRTIGMGPHYSQQRQALGYAIAWAKMYPVYFESGSIVAVVRDKMFLPRHDLRGGWMWEAVLTNDHIRDVLETVDWVRLILTDPSQARDTQSKGKCSGCEYGHRVGTGDCDRDKSLA